jgi:predicted permease
LHGKIRHDPRVEIVGIIFPVFAVAVVGYALAAARVLRPEDIAGLTRYVFSVALPVMLFHSMATVSLPETVRWSFLVAYYLPALAIYLTALVLGRVVFGHSRREQAVFGMSAGYSNTVLIGLPVITAAWGDEGLLPLLMIVAIHSAVMFSLATAIAESGGGVSAAQGEEQGSSQRGAPGSARGEARGTPQGATQGTAQHGPAHVFRRTVAGMIRNPIVVGLAAGLLFNILSIALPAPITGTLELIRASAVPVALFVTGASLREYRVMGHIGEAAVIILFKMVVHPLAVWVLATFVFELPAMWAAVAVVTAALPTGINASVFARKYEAAVAPVVTATLLSTLLSIVTVSVVLALYS